MLLMVSFCSDTESGEELCIQACFSFVPTI